jgi:chromosome segregation ATPase
MEIQIGSDALGSGRKRNRSGYEYLRSWRENVEGQLHEETRVKAGLLVLLEQEKRKVKELAEQLMHSKVVVQEHERKVDHLGDELMEMESRVRNLESDKYFLDANLVERSNEVAQLKAECTQLEIRSKHWRSRRKKYARGGRLNKSEIIYISLGQRVRC